MTKSRKTAKYIRKRPKMGRPKLYHYTKRKRYKRIPKSKQKKKGYEATDPYTYLYDSTKNQAIIFLNQLYDYNSSREYSGEEWCRYYLGFEW